MTKVVTYPATLSGLIDSLIRSAVVSDVWLAHYASLGAYHSMARRRADVMDTELSREDCLKEARTLVVAIKSIMQHFSMYRVGFDEVGASKFVDAWFDLVANTFDATVKPSTIAPVRVIA